MHPAYAMTLFARYRFSHTMIHIIQKLSKIGEKYINVIVNNPVERQTEKPTAKLRENKNPVDGVE